MLLPSKADRLLWKKKLVDFELGHIHFKAIEAPHQKVHALAKKAAQRRKEDRKTQATDLRKSLNHKSDEAVRLLGALVKEKITQKHASYPTHRTFFKSKPLTGP